jgi:hypothetical protein
MTTPKDQAQIKVIEFVENELKRISDAIASLEKEKQDAYEIDEDYSGFRGWYAQFCDDEPLGIRPYYSKMARLQELNGILEAAAHGDDYGKVLQEHMPEIAKLERLLAA